jgi:hypothetical protein
MRFAVFRWVELLDPSSHFCVGASSLIDPLTGIRELREAIKDMGSLRGARPGEVLERSEAFRRILALNGRLHKWYPKERQALVQKLRVAEQGVPRNRRRQETWPTFENRRRQIALTRFSPILANELAQFEGRLLDPVDGYLQQLLTDVRGRLVQTPPSFAEWRQLDHALQWLAAHALEHGRDHHSLAVGVLGALERAGSIQKAADDFVAIFGMPQRPFSAAISVEGVAHIRRADQSDCLPVTRRPIWPGKNTSQNKRLEKLLEDARARRGGPACVVVTQCQAWDPGHARQKALAAVAQLIDHVCAEHPAADIRFGHSVLVRDEQSGHVKDASQRLRSIRVAQARKPQEEFTRSLRFYGIARQETVPVVSVLHTWIALEDLAGEAKRQTPTGTKPHAPGAFLPPHAGAAVALACTQAQLTSTFQTFRALAKKMGEFSAWREIEDWLGVKAFGPPIPLPAWLQLICAASPGRAAVPPSLDPKATQTVAGAFLWALASRLGPFVQFRLEELSKRLRNGGELSNWASEIRMLAELHLVRMRFLRHATVHRARHSDEAARQLAVASHDIADAVYEVLPLWLNGGNATWEGFRDLRNHLEDLIRLWVSATGRPSIDPDHLLHP